MTTGITPFGSGRPIVALPRGIHDAAADELRANVRAEDSLVADALKRVGEPVPDAIHLPLQGPTEADLERVVTMPARRHTYVPVGTGVVTGPTALDKWTVVGGSGDQLHLAQRTPDDGMIVTARRGWRELVERNPALLDGPIVDVTGQQWLVMGAEGVEHLGTKAPAQIVSRDHAAVASILGIMPPTTPTTWGDVITATGLDQRAPVVTRPESVDDVLRLRDVVGDSRFVSSALGEPYGLRDAVIGSDQLPGRGLPVLDDAASMQKWYSEKAGINVWGAGQEALFTTDKRDFLANAAAAAIGGDAYTYEGPRSDRVRGTWLNDANGDFGQHVRKVNKVIREYDVAVRTHEGGHVATMRVWGPLHERAGVSPNLAKLVEDSIVQEAVSDLFGAARTGEPSVGVRDLGRLAKGWGSYEQLQELMAKTPMDKFDVHLGTQLVTKPMKYALADLGGDALAEITGAAVHDVGRQLANGSIETVTIPDMAKALRTATAWRHGEESVIVRHLDEAWKLLKVLP